MLLQEQVERLQNQLDDEKANNKLLEDALDKSLLKMDLILASHRVTTQLFSQN